MVLRGTPVRVPPVRGLLVQSAPVRVPLVRGLLVQGAPVCGLLRSICLIPGVQSSRVVSPHLIVGVPPSLVCAASSC
jgi:hypothetical protein